MNYKKSVFLIGVTGILAASVIYCATKFSSPYRALKNTESNIQELSKTGQLKDGDIIFQTSLSSQSRAIQLATHSVYSHCGIIYKDGNNYFVFEAVQPVKKTPLDKWIARGKDGHYVIKRLRNAEQVLTPQSRQNMKQIARAFSGKDYDRYFEWSDDKMYCSELIWKIYQRATGFELGKLQKMSNFDLSNPAVKQKMKERYGNHVPLNETVISPSNIFNSPLLVIVIAG